MSSRIQQVITVILVTSVMCLAFYLDPLSVL